MLVELIAAGLLGQASPQGPAPQAEQLLVPRQRVVSSPATEVITQAVPQDVTVPRVRRGWVFYPPCVRVELPKLNRIQRPVTTDRVVTEWVPIEPGPEPVPVPVDELRIPRKGLPPLPQQAPAKASPQAQAGGIGDPDRVLRALERLEERLDQLEENQSRERSTAPPPPAIPKAPKSAWSSEGEGEE